MEKGREVADGFNTELTYAHRTLTCTCPAMLLNRVLIRASVDAIDYVVTHELCNMRQNHHGGAFFDLLDRVMPDWEKRKL